MEKYNKIKISIEGWLLGRGYYNALAAFEFAKKFHIGFRKDAITPEFQHQLEIAFFIMDLNIPDMENIIASVFLHDVSEDYGVGFEEIETKFGPNVRRMVYLLTKKYRGTKKTPVEYFTEIALDRGASLIKGADRINNVNSMIGVFSVEKQKAYIKEVEEHILPMLKQARKNFPELSGAYHTIKYVLETQIRLIKVINESK